MILNMHNCHDFDYLAAEVHTDPNFLEGSVQKYSCCGETFSVGFVCVFAFCRKDQLLGWFFCFVFFVVGFFFC